MPLKNGMSNEDYEGRIYTRAILLCIVCSARFDIVKTRSSHSTHTKKFLRALIYSDHKQGTDIESNKVHG